MRTIAVWGVGLGDPGKILKLDTNFLSAVSKIVNGELACRIVA